MGYGKYVKGGAIFRRRDERSLTAKLHRSDGGVMQGHGQKRCIDTQLSTRKVKLLVQLYCVYGSAMLFNSLFQNPF